MAVYLLLTNYTKKVQLHLIICFKLSGFSSVVFFFLSVCHRNWSVLPLVEPCAASFFSSSSSLECTAISHLEQHFIPFNSTVPLGEKRRISVCILTEISNVLLHTITQKLLLNLLPVNCVEDGTDLCSMTLLCHFTTATRGNFPSFYLFNAREYILHNWVMFCNNTICNIGYFMPWEI